MSPPIEFVHGLIEDCQRNLDAQGPRAPSYRRIIEALMRMLTRCHDEDVAWANRLARAWSERPFHTFFERPLLLQASLRLGALHEGIDNPLWGAIGQFPPDADQVSDERIRAALDEKHEATWGALRGRSVQTNETFRSVIWRWPAALAGASNGGRPIALFDLGTSAGLNLIADELPAHWRDATGVPLPVAEGARVVARYGFDARPLDVTSTEDQLWMRACIWPDDQIRLSRLMDGISAMQRARAQGAGPVIERCDASEMPGRLEAIAGELPSDVFLLAFESYMREYLEPEKRRRYEQDMLRWVADRPRGGAAYVVLEGVRAASPGDPGSDIHAWVRGPEGPERISLATCGFHPTDVSVLEGGATRFGEACNFP